MPRRNESPYSLLARLSGIITVLPASMIAGGVAGHYLVDRFLGTAPWGTIVGVLAGAGTGFYEIVHLLLPPRRNEPGGSHHDVS